MNKDGIPTFTITLPDSGYEVVMHEYLTTGEARALQKIILEKGKFNPQTSQFETMDSASFLDMQDKAAEYLIKSYSKEQETKPFDTEWLFNLPVADGNLIYEKINEITGKSNLTPEDKKK